MLGMVDVVGVEDIVKLSSEESESELWEVGGGLFKHERWRLLTMRGTVGTGSRFCWRLLVREARVRPRFE